MKIKWNGEEENYVKMARAIADLTSGKLNEKVHESIVNYAMQSSADNERRMPTIIELIVGFRPSLDGMAFIPDESGCSCGECGPEFEPSDVDEALVKPEESFDGAGDE